MSNTRRGRQSDSDAFTHNSDCRIDFQKGLFICIGPDGETITKRIVLTRSPKKKDVISIYEALRLAGLETTQVVPATLSFTPVRDPDNKDDIRVYVPAVVASSGQIGFLYDDGGKFAFTSFVAGGTKVFIPDDNCNVIVDIIGQEVPTKEEFEKAFRKLAGELDVFETYRERILFLILYPFLYVHFLRRPIVTITGPFRTGKTTILELVTSIVGRDAMIRVHGSLAGVRNVLAYKHVILDDFGEGAMLEDQNLTILLEYHDRGSVVKVDDRLKARLFAMRGVLYLSGGYTINLLRLRSYADRLMMIDIKLPKYVQDYLKGGFNSLIKDADYYRWAFSWLYLNYHKIYLSLATRLDMPWRHDDIFIDQAINQLLIYELYDPNSIKKPLEVENVAKKALENTEDPHISILKQILTALVKKRATEFKKNKVFRIKDQKGQYQEAEFYLVQYVKNIEIPIVTGQGTESVTATESIGATKTKSRSVTISRPKQYASPSMVRAVLEMYPYLNEYFIVAAPDGKTYAIWVRADAVDEAARKLLEAIFPFDPKVAEEFPALDDEIKQYVEELRKKYGMGNNHNGSDNANGGAVNSTTSR